MIAEILAQELRGASMPFVNHSERGLAWKIYERLWLLAKGRLAMEALERFVVDKLDAAQSNLEQIESMEFPQVASAYQARLHSVYTTYEDALLGLAHLLERAGQEHPQPEHLTETDEDQLDVADIGEDNELEFEFDPEPTLNLAEAIRLFQLADSEFDLIEKGLEQQIDHIPTLSQVW